MLFFTSPCSPSSWHLLIFCAKRQTGSSRQRKISYFLINFWDPFGKALWGGNEGICLEGKRDVLGPWESIAPEAEMKKHPISCRSISNDEQEEKLNFTCFWLNTKLFSLFFHSTWPPRMSLKICRRKFMFFSRENADTKWSFYLRSRGDARRKTPRRRKLLTSRKLKWNFIE